MKVKSSLRLLCKGCKFVKRRKRNFVVCTSNPKHKQRQGYHTFASGGALQQPSQVATKHSVHPTTCSCHGCGGFRRQAFSFAAPLGGVSVGTYILPRWYSSSA